LAAVYQDKAMSGASLLRPGIQQLLNDGGRRQFDVDHAAALDRISRDQEDVAAVFKRLQFEVRPLAAMSAVNR
jgi:DNA invertase Pin-like site-specific DNA recombinase